MTTANGHVSLEEYLTYSAIELRERVQAISQKALQITSSQEAHNIIDEIDELNDNLGRDLDKFVIFGLKKHQLDIMSVELNRTRLSTAINSCNELTNVFSNANDLGYLLTFKIKAIDKEMANVNKTLKYVRDTQILKNNINQANYAIEHDDCELAANCISEILSNVDKDLIDGKFASAVIPSTEIPELPRTTIDNWIDMLSSKFKTNFEDAVKIRDVKNITKYFQLFPLIGKEKIGLDCYSRFICQIISDSSSGLVGTLTKNTQNHIGLLMFGQITQQLFENVLVMLLQHDPLIRKYYSKTYPNAMQYVVSKIQLEVDSQIGLISDTFYDIRRVDKVLQDIRLYDFPILNKHNRLNDVSYSLNDLSINDSDELVSIVQSSDLMSELGNILYYWNDFGKFIASKYFRHHEEEHEFNLPDIISQSKFNSKIHDKLLPAYEKLWEFYIKRSIEKAITIEDLPDINLMLVPNPNFTSLEQPPVSSVIEDVTLVLNTSVVSVTKTCIPSTVKKFMVDSFTIVQKHLIEGFFVKTLAEFQPRYNQQLVHNPVTTSTAAAAAAASKPALNSPFGSRSGTPMPDQGAAASGMGFFKGAIGNVVGSSVSSVASTTQQLVSANRLDLFIVYLNSVAVGQEYFTKIIKKVLNPRYLKEQFPYGNDSTKMHSIIEDDFLTPFTHSTNRIISDNIVNMFEKSFKNRLATMVNEFIPEANEHYIIHLPSTLNETANLLKFQSTWLNLIGPYRQTCHKTLILSKLMRLIVVNLSNFLEKRILSMLKKFRINELGALKLDKDLSFLINAACGDNYELKEKFVRITQLVYLLGLDDDEYSNNETDLGGDEELSDGLNWVLSPQERKQYRKLRI
ncbi:uncharacterized protein KQ657_003656 [Scheffersomyces spartinae]|uniref:Conserved oligomeric Golgi complex subunit 4 n=1 Tax=Scheffersomyces spartinae TaxID=45513 RepID=A0A9P8AJS6_9ASCO|nr:uncharacterized protein KQ657_003656 [Scheffersomyces spartinae]KAG7195135.1 hypothetical protein KQ657_003656 [Scheffersomyces spartinae]